MVLTVWPQEITATRHASTLKVSSAPNEQVLDRCDPIGPATPAAAERDGTMLTIDARARLGAEANASTTDEGA